MAFIRTIWEMIWFAFNLFFCMNSLMPSKMLKILFHSSSVHIILQLLLKILLYYIYLKIITNVLLIYKAPLKSKPKPRGSKRGGTNRYKIKLKKLPLNPPFYLYTRLNTGNTDASAGRDFLSQARAAEYR